MAGFSQSWMCRNRLLGYLSGHSVLGLLHIFQLGHACTSRYFAESSTVEISRHGRFNNCPFPLLLCLSRLHGVCGSCGNFIHGTEFCFDSVSLSGLVWKTVGSDEQSHKTVSTNHNLFEEKGEPKRYRTEGFRFSTSLTE